MDSQQLEQTEKQIKQAWIAGSISAVITFIYSLLGAYNESIRLEYGVDTWTLIDVALLAGLSYGIYKKSRFCALSLLIYFIASKFILMASTGQFTGGVVSLVFAYFFFQGTLATFKYHKHLKEASNDETKQRNKGFGYYFGVSLGSLLVLLFIVLMVIGSISPEIEVIPGKQVNEEYIKFVYDEDILSENEEIQFWYSDAVLDFKEGFYFFTDKKVVVYSQQWQNPLISIPFSEITYIEFAQDPSFFEDSRITLTLIDDSIIFFPVSSDNSGDERFYGRLFELWQLYRDISE